jgi:hypothetical protein
MTKEAQIYRLQTSMVGSSRRDIRKRFRLYCAQLFQGIVMTRLGTALRPAATRVMLLGSGELGKRSRHRVPAFRC